MCAVLDPRPEPAGARLTIERDDPTHVILKVALPGFTLENITVAMRRGHRVHIVADSYGENGGMLIVSSPFSPFDFPRRCIGRSHFPAASSLSRYAGDVRV